LAVRTTGVAGAPIVLLHGLAASALVWGANFEVLGRAHRVIVPDLYGFGDSMTDAATGFGPDDHVEQVMACLTALGADDEPMLAAGHSMGALIALRLAANHPDRVRAVVGFAPPLFRTQTEATAHISGIDPMARMLVLDTPLARRACQWVCEHRRAAAVLAQLLRPDLPAAIAPACVIRGRPTPRACGA
jgi:pimeloyl-ACP methyl ester carboxylesterase